ncbi:hypothetical protein A2480_04270 [Candidatus Uhrbacteria bacterium RIFOXYC2_FULL_47_19]|uniref:Peptidase E n=1 Tax=Candidatus Uhrbacteria bacterium RIFOXYC2_FULL_47_19 TaxID=1802424 RepID=A0A1F7WDH6_9BACT|nr:MAG: hypothetical protein A2480_04270 [Candidatus Uhrbacteria bacterium RIFOXYC2_FULL_47_19]
MNYDLMKLFLTSSCIPKNLREPFLAFLGKPPEQIKLFFIPTASDVEDNKFYTCQSMDDFSAVGIDPIWYSLRFKTKEQIARELATADVVWVNGGNTFYLLDAARRTGFMEIVSKLVRDCRVMYGGTSAGSILASPTIAAAGWGGDGADKNAVGLTDLASFGFVPFTTHVHYDPAIEKDELLANKRGTPIYAVPDGCAIQVENEKIVTLGDVEIFD